MLKASNFILNNSSHQIQYHNQPETRRFLTTCVYPIKREGKIYNVENKASYLLQHELFIVPKMKIS